VDNFLNDISLKSKPPVPNSNTRSNSRLKNTSRNLPALQHKDATTTDDADGDLEIITKPTKSTLFIGNGTNNINGGGKRMAPLPLSHLNEKIQRPSSELSNHKSQNQRAGGVLKVVQLAADTTKGNNNVAPPTQRSARSRQEPPRVLDLEQNKRDAAKSTTIGEMFPNRIDNKGRKIKLESENDLKLTYNDVKKEIRNIKKEMTREDGDTRKSESRKSSNRRSLPATGITTPIADLEKRLRRVRYYRKIISFNLLAWNEYKTERDIFITGKKTKGDDVDYNVVIVHGDEIEMEIRRFDDEFRRVKLRANRELSPQAKKAIEKVDPAAAAEGMVDRIMERLKDRGDDQWKEVDREMEKEKLTEEITRWKNRWMSAQRVEPQISSISDSEDDDDFLLDDEFEDLDGSLVGDDDEDYSYDTEDGVEVIIVNDVGHITQENNSFFLTITGTNDQMMDGYEKSDDEKEEEQDRKSAIRTLKRLSSGKWSNSSSPTNRLLERSPRSNLSSPRSPASRGSPTLLAPVKPIGRPLPEVRISSQNSFRNNTPTIDWDKEARNVPDDVDDSVILDEDEFNQVPSVEADFVQVSPFDDSAMSSQDFSPKRGWGLGRTPRSRDISPRSSSSLSLSSRTSSDQKDTPTKEKPQKRKQAQVTQLLQHLKDELEYSEQVKQIKRDQQNNPKDEDDEDDDDDDDDDDDKKIPDEPAGKFSPRLTRTRGRSAEDEEERKRRKRLRRLVVELDHVLGTGGHGKVYRGQITDTDEVVAIKKIPVKAGKFSKKFVKLEIDILRTLSHPNLVRYMGCKYSSKFREYSIVLEYVDGGSLEQIIKKRGPMSEEQVAGIVQQTLHGLSHLHSKRVIHRDLKPGNILLTRSGQIKITDFGVSAQLLNIESMRSSCVGTPYYSAPEVIQVVPYSYQADIWSLGCAVYEMLFGCRPYHDLNQVAAMYRMVKDGHPPVPVNNTFSADCLNFLHSCWIVDWKMRPTADELKEHVFVKGKDAQALVVSVFD
jgi:hypothetical protein